MTYHEGIGFIGGRPKSSARQQLGLCASVVPTSSLDRDEINQITLTIWHEFDGAVETEVHRVTEVFARLDAFGQTLHLLPPTELYQALVAASSSMLETYHLFEADAECIAELGIPYFKNHVSRHIADAKRTHEIALQIAAGGGLTTVAQGKAIADTTQKIVKITNETNQHQRDSNARNNAAWGDYFRR